MVWSVFLLFGLDFYISTSWFLWVGHSFRGWPGFLEFSLNLYGLIWISLHRSSSLRIIQDFYTLISWFLCFGLDVYGLVWISRVDPYFYELIWISMHCLWFQWTPLELYAFYAISIGFVWILMSWSSFLQFFLRFYDLCLISIFWSWFLRIFQDVCILIYCFL